MASLDHNLTNILDRMLAVYPKQGLPQEIEFALVGYTGNGIRLDDNWTLGIDRYSKILKGLLEKHGLDNPDPTVMITVSSNNKIGIPEGSGNARARITDDGTGKIIRQFCVTNTCDDKHVAYELKKRLHAEDMPEYGVRLRYSTEDDLPPEHLPAFKQIIQGKQALKRYRYAQRYSIDFGDIGSHGTTLKVDFSSVRSNSAVSFSGAQVVGNCVDKVRDQYEIEIELFNSDGITKDDLNEIRNSLTLQNTLQYIIIQAQGGISNEVKDNGKTAAALRSYVIMCRHHWGSKLPEIQVDNYISQKTLVDTSTYFLGPSIATINRGVLKNERMLPKNDVTTYYFTDKADGERCLLFIDQNQNGMCYAIMKSGLMVGTRREGLARTITFSPTNMTLNMPSWRDIFGDKDIKLDNPPNLKHRGTVLDGELLKLEGKYYFLAFDIVLYMGQYVSLMFPERYAILKTIKKHNMESASASASTLNFLIKDFIDYTPEDFKEFIEDTTKFHIERDDVKDITGIKFTTNGISYDLDGIVFQPANELYPALTTSWRTVFKYKPISMLTVDLHLGYDRKLPQTNGNEIGMNPVETPDTYGVFMASYKPRGKNGLEASPHPCYAKIVNGYARTINNEPINRGNIVECRVVVGQGKPYWEPLRIRHDKHAPNSVLVHQEVMDQLYEPILLENFCQNDGGFGGKYPIADHNRWISNQWIINWVKRIKRENIRLLDLACGNIKSGSAWITLQKGFNAEAEARRSRDKRVIKIVGVDSCKDNATNITTCYIYMSSINGGSNNEPLFNHRNYNFFQQNMLMPLHKSDNIELRNQVLTAESFNVVTCIFAIYYTFKSEENFRAFLANVSRNLKTGGLFICSYMNGKHVRKLLENGGEASGGDVWKLQQMGNYQDKSPFGHKVKVSFGGLYIDNEEYLVDFTPEVLKIMLDDYGLRIRNDQQFDTKNGRLKLNDMEKAWATLHHNICFQKEPLDNGSLDAYDHMFEDSAPAPAPAPAAGAAAAPKAKAKVQAKVQIKAKVKAKPKKPEKPEKPVARQEDDD